MDAATNELVLTLALLALGIYFSVLLLFGLLGYRQFRRVRETALATWPAGRRSDAGLLLVLGVVAAVLALVNALLARPFHHVYAQAVMALYFVLMVPLLARIRRGFYRDGVWADAGFLGWGEIGRLSFRDEGPEPELILLPHRGFRSFRLRIPRGEYGLVRKILAEQARARVLRVDPGILGL